MWQKGGEKHGQLANITCKDLPPYIKCSEASPSLIQLN